MRNLVLSLSVVALLQCPLAAHFVWIQSRTESDGSIAFEAGFGEPGGYDGEYSEKIKDAIYSIRTVDGQSAKVVPTYSVEDEAYVTKLSNKAPAVLTGSCVWGVTTHGSKEPALLTYYAKQLLGDPAEWDKLQPTEGLKMEVVAHWTPEGLALQVLGDGKPVPNADLSLYGPKTKSRKKVHADEQGRYLWEGEGAGIYKLFVGRKLAGSGEYEGETYAGLSEYTTLVVTIPTDAPGLAGR